MKITLVAGARPNFMKIAPIIHAIQKQVLAGYDIKYRLVHTGQHYDRNMSGTFFEELNIPSPDSNLGVGSGTQAQQTGAIMVEFEKEISEHRPDLVIVVGDVTSTMACSITAKKAGIKVAHVEAGIRSFDMTMPEEINRLVTDSLADYFFTTTEIANENLIKSGVDQKNIFYVGNVMIDTLLKKMPEFNKPDFYENYNLNKNGYFVLTLHRPSNVDEPEKLEILLSEIVDNVNNHPVIFPVHPRTSAVLNKTKLKASNLITVQPLGYLQFNYLVQNAKCVITDSGGITEETTVMGIPCMTLRDNTERPETCTIGTNELIGSGPEGLKPALKKLFEQGWKKGGIPNLWDGKTSERIVEILLKLGL